MQYKVGLNLTKVINVTTFGPKCKKPLVLKQ